MMDPDQLSNNFAFHPATSVTIPLHEQVRLLCGTMAQELNEILPDGRHKSLAMTKLEEVGQMANAAIAINLAPREVKAETPEAIADRVIRD